MMKPVASLRLLLEPGRLRRGLDAMIEAEERASRGEPDREIKFWHDKLQEAERMRSGYQDPAAKGLLTYEELGEAEGSGQRQLDLRLLAQCGGEANPSTFSSVRSPALRRAGTSPKTPASGRCSPDPPLSRRPGTRVPAS
jgi:hypothetical protein